MSNLLITVARQSDLDTLLNIAKKHEGHLSRSPLSIEIPPEKGDIVASFLSHKQIPFQSKAIGYSQRQLEAIAPLKSKLPARRQSAKSYLAFGEKKTAKEWAADPWCVVSLKTLYSRLTLGWAVEKALSQPPQVVRDTTSTAFGESKTLSQWAKDPRCTVPSPSFFGRVRLGWGVEKAMTTPLMRSPSCPATPPCPKCGSRTVCRESTKKPNPIYKRKGGCVPGVPTIKRRVECVNCKCTFTLYFPIQIKEQSNG